DRGISGTTDSRPEFLRMISDSAKKYFSYVLVYQLDRFARNRYDSATYKAKLKKNGVRVLSARENINEDASGILMEAVLEGMAEYYSVELGQKIKRGLDLRAEKHLFVGGQTTLGYKSGKDGKFEIDPKTAHIVKSIFEQYANGKTVAGIIINMNAQGFKTSTGGEFNKNSLRTMLKNKKYIGIYSYCGKDTPDIIPRIVSDELFYKVQGIMEANKKAPARKRAKAEYILTTKLFCGYCKEMLTGYSGTSGGNGKVYNYYRCNGSLLAKKGNGCKKKNVKKDYIEDLVIAECRKQLTPENIKKIANEISTLCEIEKNTDTLKQLNKRLADVERRQKNIARVLTESEDEAVRRLMYEEIPTLEKEKTAIEKEITLETVSKPSLTAPQIQFFLKALTKGDVNDIKYSRALISIFVNKIYLYDDKLTIIFNSGDTKITINDKLLSDIERDCAEVVKVSLKTNMLHKFKNPCF
ncbi:MAG: recombinase family protein, partial [Oscillospiraceae bacterium]|nr:recombinase family protein [Oscillospiraceae bacterium]